MVYPAAHGAGRASAAAQSGLARRFPADRRRCARIQQTTLTAVQSTSIQRFGSAADRMTEFDPTALRAASPLTGGFMDNSTPPRGRASNTRPIRQYPRTSCRTAGYDAGFHEDTPCLARPTPRFVLRPVASSRGRPVLSRNSAGAMVPYGAAPPVVALLRPWIEKRRKRLASGLGKSVRLQWGACCPSNSHAGVMRQLPARSRHSFDTRIGVMEVSTTSVS